MAVVYAGGTYVNATFTGDSKSAISAALLSNLVSAGWTNVAYVGGGVGFADQTFTITIASPGVVTLSAHGLSNNDTVVLKTTGALPSGLSANTKYFVRNVATNTFELSTSSGGSSINTSGTQSGTHKVSTESILLRSATQSGVTNPMRVRLKDNLATCVQVSIENNAGTLAGASNTSSGGQLLPAVSQTMRIIATKYWFMCFVPGAVSARSYVYAGMQYVDSSILSSVTDVGFMFCNCVNDSGTTAYAALRTGISLTIGATGNNNGPNWTMLYNASMLDNASDANGNVIARAAPPELLITTQSSGSFNATQKNYRWANDALLTSDLLLSSGIASTTDEGKVRGQLYDAIYISDAVAMDATDTFSGHSWYNITNNNASSGVGIARGGMWVRTDT